MVVSGRRLGLVAAVGLLFVVLLAASCTSTPSIPTATTLRPSTSISTSVSETSGISSTSSTPRIGETQSTIFVETIGRWADYELALHRVDWLLQKEDLRMAELATDIDRTAPDIPEVVSDELRSMFIELQQAEMTLSETPEIPSLYREAHDLLLQAAGHMLMRINQTGVAVQTILNSGEPTSGNPHFQVARNYRDYYRETYAQYRAAVPGGQRQEGPTISPPSTADPSPEALLRSELSGDGYAAYEVNHAKEGETMVTVVGVRVDTWKYTQATDHTIFDHATTLAKRYWVATSEGERLRVELVEATPEQKVIESREFDLTVGLDPE